MKIALVDLRKQYQSIKKEIDSAVEKVMERTDFILGSEVREFGEKIAHYLGAKYAVGVASGTDALLLALKASGIGEEDEVITTPFTFIATGGAIMRTGAKPVFCDIEEKTYNIDAQKIEEKIIPKTKAIVPVHLYGLPCQMNKILSVARKYNLKVIEDCAQSFGAEFKGKKVGAIGDIGCFSFFPSKILGAFGDGGMVVTSDEEVAQKIRALRNHGSIKKYYYSMHGFNRRLDTLQATILKVKLNYVDNWIKMRQEKTQHYKKHFSKTEIITPFIPDYAQHCFNYYTIRIKEKRDSVLEHLKKNGIGCAIYYSLCMHLQTPYEDLGYKLGDFPVAEKAQSEVLSLPIYPELEREEIEEIARRIKEV